jgi:hypothetical protein
MTTEQTTTQEEALPRLDKIYWALALIWVGLVFGADSMGILPQIGGSSAWTWIFLGGGIAGLLLSLYSLSSPDYATPTTWDYIWSGLLIILGLGSFTTINISWWPLVLILIGVVSVANILMRRD